LLARIERLESSRPAAAAPPAEAAASPRSPSAPATAAGRAAAPQQPGAGRTAVAVTAQVEGQPPVAAAATLPGASHGGQAEASARAEQAAAAVSAELATEADPAPAVAAVAVVEPDAPAPEATFSAAVELSPDALAELWPAIIESLGEDAPMLAAALHDARPAGLGDGELTVAWPESAGFSKRKADDPASKETIARVIRAVTGSSLRLAFELRDDAALATGPAAPQLTEEDLVNRFVEEFDAEVLPPEEEST
jgi:DNA polymerase III subunit gamma/tau